MADESFRLAPCTPCGQGTRHETLATRRVGEEAQIGEAADEVAEVGRNTYILLECRGCGTVILRHDFEDYTTSETTTRYYPPPIYRRRPRWLHSIPDSLSSLFRELYVSLAANAPRLSVMGARTLVDIVMTEKIGDVGTFADKLKELEAKGFIGRLNRQHLEAALDAGSAVAHRGHSPSTDSVNQVIDIVENLVEAVYVLPNAATNLGRETPPRRV
jgi:hypothetical protein